MFVSQHVPRDLRRDKTSVYANFIFPNGYKAELTRDPLTCGNKLTIFELCSEPDPTSYMISNALGGRYPEYVYYKLSVPDIEALLDRIASLPPRLGA